MTAWRGAARQAPVHMVTRFAPSPTGRLHLGHAYSALVAHDAAHAAGGRFLLRIEDIDDTRSRPEHIEGILADLRWLGLDWDGPVVRQSERRPLYAEALARLRDGGLAYPCFCTRADIAREIAASGAAPHGPAEALYPGICRRLPPRTRAARMEREAHAWRLDVAAAAAAAGPLDWLEGEERVAVDPGRFGDVIVARKDIAVAYHLAVVVDDAAQGVTDIIRGEDLREATHVHRLLQALLDLPVPRYRHHRLIADADGRRLAKRDGAISLAELRASGADPAMLREALRAGRLPVGFGLAEA